MMGFLFVSYFLLTFDFSKFGLNRHDLGLANCFSKRPFKWATKTCFDLNN